MGQPENAKVQTVAEELWRTGLPPGAVIGIVAKNYDIPPGSLHDALALRLGLQRNGHKGSTRGRGPLMTERLYEIWREKQQPTSQHPPISPFQVYAAKVQPDDTPDMEDVFTYSTFNAMAAEILRLQGELDRAYKSMDGQNKEKLSKDFWKVYEELKVRA